MGRWIDIRTLRRGRRPDGARRKTWSVGWTADTSEEGVGKWLPHDVAVAIRHFSKTSQKINVSAEVPKAWYSAGLRFREREKIL